jgi:gamma-glutamyltranspeptidase / glutathione hydrolase
MTQTSCEPGPPLCVRSAARVLAGVLLTSMLFSPASSAQSRIATGDRPAGLPHATRSTVIAQNGMAATSHPLASLIAIDVLKGGGNAVDAAIAANAALGLVEPASNGIGGDLFAIVWDAKTARLYGLNASGRSPAGLGYEQLRAELGDRTFIPMHGPLATSVPGAVDGWFELHARFGQLPMARLLQPSIEYAETGVPVPQIIARNWQVAVDRIATNRADITDGGNFEKTFTIGGRAPREGDVFRNRDLARTYRLIAEGGRDVFYRGAIAEAMDAYARRVGMHLRKADFEAHTSTWVDPVSITYRGYDIYQLPPNGQGIAGLQMLNILEGFDLAAMGHNSADYLHVQTEAKKLAFADRARYYADPEFSDIPLDWLLSKEYAAERRALVDMRRARREVDAGVPAMRQGDTVYLAVADRDGNMVSLIQSNFLDFGSGMVPDGLGFAFQSRGAAFTLEPGHPNVYAPGKRPFHTIIPGFIMKDDRPHISFGVMGGPVQPQGHVQIVCNLIDFGMGLQEAGDAARYVHAGSSEPTGQLMTDGGRLALESRIPADVRAELERRGHTVISEEFFGGYQAIMWDPERRVYIGASEMRKDGHAVGY